MRVVALLALLVACGSSKDTNAPAAPPAAPIANAGSGSAAPTTPAQPSGTGDPVILAKLTNAGPIGDGNCSQRSYELEVTKWVDGEAPSDQTFWAHFERCAGETVPVTPGNLAGTGLKVGTTYKLTLRRDASKNFAGAYMIIDARVP